MASFASWAATMLARSRPLIARRVSSRSCPHGGPQRCSISGELEKAREEAQRFVNGMRSFWVGSSAPTDEAVARWVLQAHPDQRQRAMGSPARRFARRRASG